ncbi:hypothetical protein [Dyella mobilis]|uniref:DUF3077 domain-containing protein n=1 Tax=Dyella mobilis TaxID=1849582 RepID=A0ABS2KAM7_9GAMM|nr:hypothetical protein [Dyella mobilis]MBM7128238.1 hypothetical protein [Dyella mobilis]GLQ99798.1 hypothetical protein GCM10007863_42180 [Dyella mobilis]
MSTHSRDQWIALHAQYLVDPQVSRHGLLMDAQIFLDSAHGIAQTMSDVMSEDDIPNSDRLCSALNGIALLVEMGRRCVAQAELRIMTGGNRIQK